MIWTLAIIFFLFIVAVRETQLLINEQDAKKEAIKTVSELSIDAALDMLLKCKKVRDSASGNSYTRKAACEMIQLIESRIRFLTHETAK